MLNFKNELEKYEKYHKIRSFPVIKYLKTIKLFKKLSLNHLNYTFAKALIKDLKRQEIEFIEYWVKQKVQKSKTNLKKELF